MTENEKVIGRSEIGKLLRNEKGILITLFRRQLEKYLLELLERLFPEVVKRIFGKD